MELTAAYIASQILTIAMYVTLAISYYMKDRTKILLINFLGCLLIGLAYLLLSAYTGAVMALISVIRNIIFLIDEKKNGKSEKIVKKDIYILIFIYLIIVIVTIPTYNSLLSLLSVFATSLFTFSVWQKKTIIYKALGIPISSLWIAYNIYVLSLFGFVLESIILIFALSGFIIEKKKRKNRRIK